MKKVVIVSAVRTAIGSFGGSLKDVSAVELGSVVIQKVIERTGIDKIKIDEVIMGNVLSAGLGQNVARQMVIHAGLPVTTTAMTINQVCGSGLKAVQLAAQSIACGDSEIVIAGGAENMSQAAYVLHNERWGMRMGHTKVEDTLLKDGLTDAFSHIHMGVTAENVAKAYHITRRQQDEFAFQSQQRAKKAIANGRFKAEIAPVIMTDRKGNETIFDTDEYPKEDVTVKKLEKLRAVFEQDGSVTAGNASGINDGAAVVMLMSEEKAKELGLKPLATIKSYATAGIDPTIMGCGPIFATRKALEKANLTVKDLDLIESNEAFAAQACAVANALQFDNEKVNVNGGAIALGHPIGASGCRVLVTLLHEMEKRNSHYGLATLCIGGGMGIALVVER